MSWLAGQRALDQIEKTLLGEDDRLASLFAFFTRLARDDAMPGRNGSRHGRAGWGRPFSRRLGSSL